MSNSLLPLRPSIHKTHGFSLPKDLSFTKNSPFSLVQINEISSLLPLYPLAFAKVKEKTFVLVSLQGLYNDENLFLNEEFKWIVNYIPNAYRSYPFVLADNILCFNMQSGLYRETPDEAAGDVRFFDDEGKIQDSVQKILSFLSERNKYREITLTAVAAIAKTDILEPWNVSGQDTSKDKKPLKGLYHINEKKLAQLTAEQLKELQEANALPIIYAQLLSMSRVELLQQLQNAKDKREEKAKLEDIDLDAIFGEGSSDSLSFGF